jgi:methionyl-tRNA formyltransferase
MIQSRRVLFIGSKQIGLAVLREMHRLAPQYLVGAITIDDRSDARSVHADLVAFCAGSRLALRIAASRTEAEAVIAELRPDLCIVVGWYWLIAHATLGLAPAGFHGIHNSSLPRYRGGSPLVWQMINGEPRAGFSIFRLTSGMDDGPIWAQGSVPIGPQDHIADVLRNLERESVSAFGRVYERLLDGRHLPEAQPVDGISFCAQRTPADGLIDWSLPAPRVFDFVRAQSEPYPGAFTFFQGDKLIIWRARVFEHPYFGAPGQIARIAAPGIHAICGGGTALTLLDVQINEVRGAASDLVRSAKFRLGGLAT